MHDASTDPDGAISSDASHAITPNNKATRNIVVDLVLRGGLHSRFALYSIAISIVKIVIRLPLVFVLLVGVWQTLPTETQQANVDGTVAHAANDT